MIAQNLIFGILSVVMGLAALRVVTTQNVVHAALYLVVVLGGVAGIFILLAAEFAAITQVLVYIGAIVVLFLFGLMLTKAPIGKAANLDNDQKFVAALVSVMLFGVLAWAQIDAFQRVEVQPDRVGTSAMVGNSIFTQYLVPFEVISVLLLAALVGAVVIARKD
ncbi:MAG TPA: NADH-quinone oxidoreductase subunit J [Acidimicrobiales bacterium]|nr:NADH-quinone oxidoreductase subunit J [Acidimicrobiales bacterium]